MLKSIAPVLLLHRLLQEGAPVCTDSRDARTGGIFFALRGDVFDGNRFAESALKAGCQLAVIDDPRQQKGPNFLLVDSVLQTLQELGAHHRKQFNIPMLGITGSNGKTTTKELIHAVLSSHFHAMATRGNLNNHIGVPLTLMEFRNPLDLGIVEMGANHLGEIARLCQLADPTHGLITNIGKAHLEGFGSLENIARAKSELYRYVETQGGTLFVNGDNALLIRLAGNARMVLYGSSAQHHCQGQIEKPFPFLEVSFKVNRAFGKAAIGDEGLVRSRLTGAYNFENIMAAVAVGLYFGVPASGVCRSIEGYEPGNHRSQVIQTDRNTVVMDAYNANPTSMQAALENFSNFRQEQTAVFLGDMLELGEAEEEEHQRILRMAVAQGFTKLVFVGPAFSKTAGKTPGLPHSCSWFEHPEQAAEALASSPISGFKVLVKGSRGIRMEQLLKHL
jgi:UDP-N-acetylmuramoyl-tripeptide--D-alanyl-D-alanine ligase